MALELTVGFLPLVDACLPILAREHGFAEAEGVSLSLIKDVSWATVLDRLLYGHSDAAHLIAPLALATTLGRGRPAQPLSVPFVLGLNGNAITVRTDIAEQLGLNGTLGDPRAAGERLAALVRGSGRKMRFGVVHRYSSHNYMLRYWLAECGIRPDEDVDIVTVPPPYCADALESGEVDGVCVGEPWNSVAVERGAGAIILVTAQIWRRGVEKVLAMREPVLEDRRDATEALIRALVTAARHFVEPSNWDTNAAILARPEYLDGSPQLIRRAIADRILLNRGGDTVHLPDFMFQYREAANFPWISQAEWLFTQLVRWDRIEFDPAEARAAAGVFRPDVYRSALKGTGEPLPGASSKVEGSLGEGLAVGTAQGTMWLENNRFFDDRIFDPRHMHDYLDRLP